VPLLSWRTACVEARESFEEAFGPLRWQGLVSTGDVEGAVVGSCEDGAEAAFYRVVKVALVSLHGGCAEVFDHWGVVRFGGEGDASCQVHISQVESEVGFPGSRHGAGWRR
jgi:hypothetical protein